MDTFEVLQSLTKNRQCCICGKSLVEISDFCDPFPLYLREENLACQECFNKHVTVLRTVYLKEEEKRIQGAEKESFKDPYAEEESPETGIIRLIKSKGIVHRAPDNRGKYVLECTLEQLSSRGWPARTAKLGHFSNLTCPTCRARLLADYPQLKDREQAVAKTETDS